MANKVERKPEFKLYFVGDDDGGFTVPEALGELMQKVELLLIKDEMDDYYRGIYDFMVEVLSCPPALFISKCESTLQAALDDTDEEEDENDIPFNEDNLPVVVQQKDLTDDEMIKVLEEQEQSEAITERLCGSHFKNPKADAADSNRMHCG